MSNVIKFIIATGAIGAVAGITHAVRKSLEDKRADNDNDAIADEPETPETRNSDPEPADPEPAPVDTAEPKRPADTRAEPLREPAHPRARVAINRSRHDANGTVEQSPAELLEQARRFDPIVTLDELTGARLAASEHANGTFTELTCIVDSELERAQRRRLSLFQSLTHRGTFGKQGSDRPASTRRDPQIRHLLAARAVLSGRARGISLGSVRFFDPEAMQRMHAKYRKWVNGGRQGEKPAIVSCDALTLLEAWSFDYGRQGANRCPPDRTKSGRDTLAWVGPIPGVDPLRLMLMKPMPIGERHTRQYQAARALLRAGLDREA